MTMIDDVRAFHERFSQPVLATPQVPSEDRISLRIRLMREEFRELLQALGARNEWSEDHDVRNPVDLVEAADGIADLIYVLIGTAHEFGIPLQAVWNEVQRSNMAKEPGNMRGDGKILKGPGWSPPRIEEVLRRHGWQP